MKPIAFLTRVRSKKLSDVVSLRADFFQFDTCGCKVSLVPYQKIKFGYNSKASCDEIRVCLS